MIFDEHESNSIYDNVYDWLANYTPGEYRSLESKEYYHKTWSLISNKIHSLLKKEKLNAEEKYFLELANYTGPIYRVHQYASPLGGDLCPSDFFHAWSKDINSVKSVRLYGAILLITGYANNAVDVFGVLTFLLKNEYITKISPYKNPKILCRYESEQEIEYPLNIDDVKGVFLIDSNNLEDWCQSGKPIPRDKWWLNQD